MVRLTLYICIASLLALAEGWNPFRKTKRPPAPFVLVNYCNDWPKAGRAIHSGAAEAQSVLQSASERLQQVLDYDEELHGHQGGGAMPDQIRSALDMYDSFIGGTTTTRQEVDTVRSARIREMHEALQDHFLTPMSNSKRPKVQITCGIKDWLLAWGNAPKAFRNKFRFPAATASADRHYYDARPLAAFTKNSMDRLVSQRRTDVSYDQRVQDDPHTLMLLDGLLWPFPEVVVLTRTGLTMWKSNPRISYLRELQKANLQPSTQNLADIVGASLAAQLLLPLCGADLARRAWATEPSKRRVFQDPKVYQDGSLESIQQYAKAKPEQAYKTPYNFAFYVVALYLNQSDWATGTNRPIRLYPSEYMANNGHKPQQPSFLRQTGRL